jgi:hypothetical protein
LTRIRPGPGFLLEQGTHVRQSVVPKDGNVFRGEPGSVLDGQNATAFAFKGWNGTRLGRRSDAPESLDHAVHAAEAKRRHLGR